MGFTMMFLIDGFYDDVQPPSAEELDLVNTITEEFSTEALMRSLNVHHFIDDLQGKELLLRYFFSPTFNLELEKGDHDSFGVGVMPHKATAKIQIRLVPQQTIQGLLQMIRAHLDRNGYADIQIKPFYGIEWGRSKLTSSITQAMLQTYLERNLNVEIWPTSPATPPPAIFNRNFGVSFMSGGVGYCGKAKEHEYFVVDGNQSIAGLQECEKTFVTILEKFTTAP
jgi:acetylornithine deacetylase/succinyl-diaminopimelate desuccinylase-like protein